MFLVSAVKKSLLKLIYHRAGMVVNLLLLKFSMPHTMLMTFVTFFRLTYAEEVIKFYIDKGANVPKNDLVLEQ